MPKEAAVDVLTLSSSGLTGMGSVANKLLANGLNINALRTNDILRKEEWLVYDRTVIDVARAQLVGVADLLTAGLRLDLPNAFGTTVVQWEKMSDMTGAQVDMHGLTDGEKDRLEFSLENVPVPITHKEFSINIRALAASRNGGMPLDTTQAAVATRRVSDSLEGTLFAGASVKAGGGQIYGYTTFPSRNVGSLTAAWSVATGAQILADFITIIAALAADNMYGPFRVYVPVAYYIHMLDDLKANSDKSILQRMQEIPGIAGIKATTQLTTGVVFVQMTSDVVDMVVGFQPVPVMWESNGGMVVNVKILAIMVPRLKADYDGRCGIAHYSQ